MNQKTKVTYLSVIALVLAFGLMSIGAIAKNDNAKAQSQRKSKAKAAVMKNFEKADVSKGTTNAQLHQKKIKEVTKNLEELANAEESSGNEAVSDQIEQAAEEQAQAQEATAEAIEELEGQGKVKTFLIGTGYKNLGQLRSSLAHNTNDIRKLTKSLTGVQTPESKLAIEAQLATLVGERERIRTIIYDKQDDFSLFGWVSRIMTGYVPLPVEDPTETQLTTEVETALASVAVENTTPTATTETPTTPVVPVE